MSDNGRKPRGWNLRAGQPDGAKGRAMGAALGGAATAALPAPAGCAHCRRMGYDSMAQHLGHLGFRALMVDRPTALHSVREKVARTGRASSRERWAEVSR